ncbi:hypothetical protein OG933_45300 (plasmid) [Streptomyces sp. NBC_00016]|uniref:ATP-dependent DNA ligase n=1 Tax=Streptomyces sp. NBC_00016 TaxID=2975622 RepID=UPI002F91052F
MLAESRPVLPPDGMLPGSLHYEQKPDGFRAIVFARADLVRVQSRQGSDLTPAFPDIAQAAALVGEDLVLDAELVVPHEGRLHFGELQRRARHRGSNAIRAAAERPAYLITGVRAGSWGILSANHLLLSRPETCVRHVPPWLDFP